MKILRNELKDAVAGLSKVVNTRSHLPALAHIRVDANGKTIRITGTDLDQVLSYEIDVAIPVPNLVSLLAPIDALQAIIKTAQGDTIEIAQDGNAIVLGCTVAGQNIVRRVSTLALAEWPVLPTPAVTKPVDGQFLESVRLAIPFASTDETRAILRSVYLDVKGKDHRIVATDGRRLTALNSVRMPLTASVIMPVTKFLAWSKLIGGAAIGMAKDTFTIQTGPWTYSIKPVDGQYPKYEQVIPDYDDPRTLELSLEDADLLIKALPGLPSEGNDKDAVVLSLAMDGVRVYSDQAAKTCENSIRLMASAYSGQDAITIGINRIYFRDALLAGFRSWQVSDPASPLLGRLTKEDIGSVHVLMPIRTSGHEVPRHAKMPEAQPVAVQTTNKKETIMNKPVEIQPQPDTAGALDKILVAYEAAKAAVRQANNALADVAVCVRDAIRDDRARRKEIADVRAGLAKLQAIRV